MSFRKMITVNTLHIYTMHLLYSYFLTEPNENLSFQVPMRPMAGERRGWRQLGKGSHWPAGVTWRWRGCWKVDRDASGAGLSFPECADSVGIAWQSKQYVLMNTTFFSTIADLLVVLLTTVTDSAPYITFLVDCQASGLSLSILMFNSSWCISSGMLSVEAQEDMRDAANNLVKHFHKPEQEVCGSNSERV